MGGEGKGGRRVKVGVGGEGREEGGEEGGARARVTVGPRASRTHPYPGVHRRDEGGGGDMGAVEHQRDGA